MKKFVFTLIASLMFASFAHAATSALTESLLEYEAITSAIGTNPEFQDVIGPSEFIVDIKRRTRRIDITGRVKYEIVTRDASTDEGSNRRVYIAILNITPNPGVGPNVITVLSIRPARNNNGCRR